MKTGVPNERLRRAMDRKGHTIESLAEAVEYHPKQVGRWLTQGVVPRRIGAPARVAEELDVRPDDIWPAAARRIEPEVGVSLDVASRFDGVDRRSLITALGGTFAGAAISPTAAFAAQKDVPPDLATYFANQLAGHYTSDTCLGARPLLDTVVTQHRVLKHAAEAAAPEGRVELLRVNVAYAGLAGWLYQDMGDLLRAWHWFCEALELAHRVGDADLVAYALANMSSLRFDAGDGPGSLELAHTALADPSLGATARRYALRDAAHAYSLTGDRNGCDRALGEGPELPDSHSGDQAPWGTAWFATHAYVDAQRATCYGRLGHTGEAADLWRTVLAQHPPTARRDRGVYLARYASALFDVEGPGAALDPATEAVTCHQHASSARMRHELTQLRNRAAARQDTPAARDLYEVLHAVD